MTSPIMTVPPGLAAFSGVTGVDGLKIELSGWENLPSAATQVQAARQRHRWGAAQARRALHVHPDRRPGPRWLAGHYSTDQHRRPGRHDCPRGQRRQLLNVGVGGNLTLQGLTVTGGFAPNSDGGGGILVQSGGQAALRNTTVAGNQSTAVGGGIANYGVTTVLGQDDHGNGPKGSSTKEAFSRVNNSAPTSGGGIYNEGQLATTNVEVSYNNSGSSGGGLTDQGAGVLVKTE